MSDTTNSNDCAQRPSPDGLFAEFMEPGSTKSWGHRRDEYGRRIVTAEQAERLRAIIRGNREKMKTAPRGF